MRRLLYSVALLFATMHISAQTYTYDSNNRLKKVVYSNGTTVTYTFDALGNRISKKVTGSTTATYTISASVTPTGSGAVNGIGKYNSGSSIELNAIANGGYKFLKWSDGVTTNPRTITVTGDLSFTAMFEESQSSLVGDIVVDGTVNVQDLNSLVNAYLANTQVTKTTDIDNDSQLSIVDITSLISMTNIAPCDFITNGHQYVDLGLPSGTLWATCNVGASAPEDTGNLYAWGEIETKDEYNWITYQWCDGDKCNSTNQTLVKYCDRGHYGVPDGKVTLEAEDDVANVNWGGDWHMPTKEEFQELIDNTTRKWTKLNNVRGYLMTGTNGNSIFLPEGVNRYWSSSLRSNSSGTNADGLDFNSTEMDVSGGLRYKGYTIRPVLSAYTPVVHKIEAPTIYNGHEMVDLGLPSGTLWAKCNLGASSPEDYGCYYAWGETIGSCEGKSSFKNSEYRYYNGSGYSKYTYNGVYQLEPGDDIAKVSWKGEWRMPTYSEIGELVNTRYTKSEWTTMNGVYGQLVTSIVKGFEGKSIFLPAAGRYRPTLKDVGERGDYWGSELVTDENSNSSSDYVRFFTVNSSRVSKGSSTRAYGCSIRPVVSLDAIIK